MTALKLSQIRRKGTIRKYGGRHPEYGNEINYGFILDDNGQSVFIHAKQIMASGYTPPFVQGMRVSYTLIPGHHEGTLQAGNIKIE